jgi:hypothetical protein
VISVLRACAPAVAPTTHPTTLVKSAQTQRRTIAFIAAADSNLARTAERSPGGGYNGAPRRTDDDDALPA